MCPGQPAHIDSALSVEGKGGRLRYLILHNNSATATECLDDYKPKPEEIPYPRPNTWLEEALAISAMLFMWIFGSLLPFMVMACVPAILLYGSKAAAVFLAITIADWLLPAGKTWPEFRSAYFFDVLRRHFRYRSIVPLLPFLDTSRPILGVFFPHSMFPMTMLLTPALLGLPGTGTPKDVEGVVANFMLTLPFYKHFFAWMGAHPADAKTFRKLLRQTNVGMLPEGLAGMTRGATPSKEAIYILKRKGFVRIAIQAGAPICPVYHFGQSQLFTYWGAESIMHNMGILVGFFYGRWYLPLPRNHDILSVAGHPIAGDIPDLLPNADVCKPCGAFIIRNIFSLVGNSYGRWHLRMPRNHGILPVAGPPIAVKQCDNPTDEEVDRLHALVVEAVVELYERYKHLLPGWEDRPLLVL